MSDHDMRVIITQQAVLFGLPAWVPICIARVESDLNPNCIGDSGTSFGLFQLHRGGLAPSSMTDEELLNPSANANVAIQGMLAAYRQGTFENLSGMELLKYVAFNSGWPGMLGVDYFEEHRPDYVQRLAKMYLEEVDAPQEQTQPQATPDPAPAANLVTEFPGSFTAYETWYISTGDTLSVISLHVHIPVDVLARFNHLEDPNTIIAGTTLLIPRVYRVRAGDTLSQICEVTGAGDYHFVCYVNAHQNPDLITTGDVLYL